MTGMELVVWNAARRLAWLVIGSLVCVAVPFVHDSRIGPVPAAAGGLALALLAASVFPLLRARRMLVVAARPDDVPPASQAYRANPKGDDRDPVERAATHHAAIALILLAVAGSLVVVAAAAR
jgi:hypothetical protein